MVHYILYPELLMTYLIPGYTPSLHEWMDAQHSLPAFRGMAP